MLQAEQDSAPSPHELAPDARGWWEPPREALTRGRSRFGQKQMSFYVEWTLEIPSAALTQNQTVSRSSLRVKQSPVLPP